MSHRLVQVNANLQRELSNLLLEQDVAENSLVTVTEVFTAPDLRQATVWISVLDREKAAEIIESLNKRSSEFYGPLRTRLKMKHIPKLTFKFDEQGDQLERLNSLLDNLSKP